MNNNNGGQTVVYGLIVALQVVIITLITLWIATTAQYRLYQETNRFKEELSPQIEVYHHNVDTIKKGGTNK